MPKGKKNHSKSKMLKNVAFFTRFSTTRVLNIVRETNGTTQLVWHKIIINQVENV